VDPSGDYSETSILFWGGLLICLVVAGFVVSLFIRRWMRGDANVHGEGFTFSDLRQLRKQGKITEVEYQRTKAALTASITPDITDTAPGSVGASAGGSGPAGARSPGIPPAPRRPQPPRT
jgi:hypothetical protein